MRNLNDVDSTSQQHRVPSGLSILLSYTLLQVNPHGTAPSTGWNSKLARLQLALKACTLDPKTTCRKL